MPPVNPAGTPASSLVPTQDALRIMFDWFNGLTDAQKATFLVSSNIPGFTTQILEPISSPYVAEITLGVGSQLNRHAYVRLDLISREWNDFYQSRTDLGTGRFTAPNGATGDLNTSINDDGFLERTYRGVQTTFDWRGDRWYLGGGYTWSRLEGNDVPEGDGTAGIRNTFGHFYPEYLNYERRAPTGILDGDQTHRARIWAGYDVPLPFGKLNASVIQSYDSGRAFSAVGSINARTAPGAPANPGYLFSGIGDTHAYYFSDRGAFRTDDTTSSDVALNYSLPIRSLEVFVQGQVLNVFNEDAVNNIYLGNMDFTVYTARVPDPAGGALQPFNPFTDEPVEGVHYRLGPNFGKAIAQDAYQTPRTYRVSFGLRF